LDRVAGFGEAFVPDIRVIHQASLEVACRAAAGRSCTVVGFADETKIPLEIVIAAADKTDGTLLCRVADAEEAKIVIGVLEKGADGVVLRAATPAELLRSLDAIRGDEAELSLAELVVDKIAH